MRKNLKCTAMITAAMLCAAFVSGCAQESSGEPNVGSANPSST